MKIAHLKKGCGRVINVVAILAFFCITFSLKAQEVTHTDEYTKVIRDRAAKIVNTLQISNQQVFDEYVNIIADQYLFLNIQQQNFEKARTGIKKNTSDKTLQDQKIKELQEKKKSVIDQKHQEYIQLLQKKLSSTQIEKVKDGMTYGVLKNTYNAYVDMIPALTETQKKKIYDWLVEARELAMDGETSDAKHGMFNKYKGKINNYLSAEGYNITEERKKWEERLKTQKKE